MLSFIPLIPMIFIDELQLFGLSNFNKGLIAIALVLIYMIIMICYKNAAAFWCQNIHKGKKFQFKKGLIYGKSRFWGVVWTTFISIIKVILWSLLLILPGIYKAIAYIHSIQVSQLEKISGSDANRVSQTFVRGSGMLRTIGNLFSISTVVIFATYILFAVVFLASFLLLSSNPVAAEIVTAVIISIISMISGMYLQIFMNFQYLIYRDENKSALTKMKRRFAKMR